MCAQDNKKKKIINFFINVLVNLLNISETKHTTIYIYSFFLFSLIIITKYNKIIQKKNKNKFSNSLLICFGDYTPWRYTVDIIHLNTEWVYVQRSMDQ